MPQLGKVITRSTATNRNDRTPANNKIKIKDGTRPAEIISVWIFNVEQKTGRNGKPFWAYTKEKTDQQQAEIKIRFDARTDIVLETRMMAYLSSKAKFAGLIQTLTGIKAGSDEMMRFDTDALVGMKVLVTTEYNAEKGYTNIKSITSAVSEDDKDDFGDVPPQRNPQLQHHQAPPQEDYGFDDCGADAIPF